MRVIIPEVSSIRPTFVDLFAGCGGMTLGLMQAGWRGLYAVEKNPMAYQTIEANFLSDSGGTTLDWPDYLKRGPIAVEDLLRGELQKHLHELKGKLQLVSGGPPCQGFSFSGRRKLDDARNALVGAYAEFVLRVQPTLLLMENVPGILVAHGKTQRDRTNPNGVGRPPKSHAQKLAERLSHAYVFQHGILDAAEFGVPQHRRRFFGVGILRDALPKNIGVVDNRICDLSGDTPTPDPLLDPFECLSAIRVAFLKGHGLDPSCEVTAIEAIGDLSPGENEKTRPCNDPQSPGGFEELAYVPPPPERANAYVRLMRAGLRDQTPNSLRLARHSKEVQTRFAGILENCRRGVRMSDDDRSLYSTTLKHRIVPLAPDKASHTLTTLPDDLIHYARPRTLTVRESARLQSFPDSFEFRGKYTTGGKSRRRDCPRFTQVGNAVPPLLAEAWGVALQKVLREVQRRAERPAYLAADCELQLSK